MQIIIIVLAGERDYLLSLVVYAKQTKGESTGDIFLRKSLDGRATAQDALGAEPRLYLNRVFRLNIKWRE